MPGCAKLVLDNLHGDATIKRRHFIAQLLQLVHGCRGQNVWPDGQCLAQLYVCRS